MAIPVDLLNFVSIIKKVAQSRVLVCATNLSVLETFVELL